jgi:hypothetical protein
MFSIVCSDRFVLGVLSCCETAQSFVFNIKKKQNKKKSNIPKVLAAVGDVLSRQNPSCVVLLRGSSIGAGYAMWNVAISDCLQSLSDSVVQATFEFAEPNQPVPQWVSWDFCFVFVFLIFKLVEKVYSLPAAQRDAKIAMVQKYGSPNVFSQFDPHMTIAYVFV